MARGPEHLENYESQNVPSKSLEHIELAENKLSTFAEQIVSADLKHFAQNLTPKLNIIRDTIFYKTLDASGKPLSKQNQRKQLEVALANTVYETKNVPKEMLVTHFKRTIEEVYSPQLRVLEQRKITLETFMGTPDEHFATDYLWKCKHFIQELENNVKHFLDSLKQTLPNTTTDKEVKEGYLAIADSMWKSSAAFADPTTWFHEFVDTMAKNEQNTADNVLNELKVA